MVLSKKKLNRKLREKVTESLTTAEENAATTKTTKIVELDAETQQLKAILEAAEEKHKLKKKKKEGKQKQYEKEKVSCEEAKVVSDVKDEGGEGVVVVVEKKRVKKRWRDRTEEDWIEAMDKKKRRLEDENGRRMPKKAKKKMAEKENEEKKSEVDAAVAETPQINHCEEKVVDPIKVYVGGIPYYSTEDDIRSFFDSCGTIMEIDCMTFPETGKFRGIAILTLKTEAAAKRALALDGSDMGGLYLKIRPYKSTRTSVTSDSKPKLVVGYNRIYVGNLSWDIIEDDLKKFFKDCKISSICFGEDKVTGDFKGYAHVDFLDSLSLNLALKLDQKLVCGRPAKISRAVSLKGAKLQQAKTVLNEEIIDSTNPAQAQTQTPDNEVVESIVPAPLGSGKMKRRTCYLCGQRGHVSWACPNEQIADAKEFVAINVRHLKFVEWTPPPATWIKLNTDGSSCYRNGNASIGGVFRDSQGSWVHGYAGFVGQISSLSAELWSIREGLKISVKKDLQNLMIETDCLAAIRYLFSDVCKEECRDIVHECKALINQLREIKIEHTPRQANLCADYMSKMFVEEPLQEFETPPSGITAILDADMTETLYTRVIR